MVAQPNRPLIDGENEWVTLTRITPRFVGRNHIHPDCWVGTGELFDSPISVLIRNVREDRQQFVSAGYVVNDLLKNTESRVNVTVLTVYDGHNLRIAEVRPSTETVLSGIERDNAWKLDVAMFGKPDVVGTVATFKRLGDSVVWSKDGAGRYVRTWGTVRTVYEGKPDTAQADIDRITAALASAGITPKQPIVEAKGATKRPGPKPSYAIVVPSGAVIPANVWALFEDRPYKNGNLIVVQLKSKAS